MTTTPEAARLAEEAKRCAELYAAAVAGQQSTGLVHHQTLVDRGAALYAAIERLASLAQPADLARWQPMHDAPRHRRFLASVDGLVRIVTYGKTSHVPMWGWILVDQGTEDADLCEPDGWMELPAAIQSATPGEPQP